VIDILSGDALMDEAVKRVMKHPKLHQVNLCRAARQSRCAFDCSWSLTH
jgi:hypothetical protein